jgi:predicted Rossmann fold flavoprotein
VLEKNKQLGKKFLLTGNGRCNITNAELDLRKLVNNYNNGEYLLHDFTVFGPEATIEFFKKVGVKVKIEKDKKVFPESNKAKSVLDVLEKFLVKNNVKILFDSEVTDVILKGKKISALVVGDKKIIAGKYIFCTGGKSYPLTGSTGFGYILSEKLGHIITK